MVLSQVLAHELDACLVYVERMYEAGVFHDRGENDGLVAGRARRVDCVRVGIRTERQRCQATRLVHLQDVALRKQIVCLVEIRIGSEYVHALYVFVFGEVIALQLGCYRLDEVGFCPSVGALHVAIRIVSLNANPLVVVRLEPLQDLLLAQHERVQVDVLGLADARRLVEVLEQLEQIVALFHLVLFHVVVERVEETRIVSLHCALETCTTIKVNE